MAVETAHDVGTDSKADTVAVEAAQGSPPMPPVTRLRNASCKLLGLLSGSPDDLANPLAVVHTRGGLHGHSLSSQRHPCESSGHLARIFPQPHSYPCWLRFLLAALALAFSASTALAFASLPMVCRLLHSKRWKSFDRFMATVEEGSHGEMCILTLCRLSTV